MNRSFNGSGNDDPASPDMHGRAWFAWAGVLCGDRVSHGQHIRGHAGGIEGTDADLAIVWETGAAVALTSNEGPGQSWLLAERIADLLAAAAAEP